MYKVLKADRDTYITNRFIKIAGSGSFRTGSNVGAGGSLDLFKLYGASIDPITNQANTELSRLLIHFNLQPLKDLVAQGKLNVNKTNFNCTLKMFDVYGGQTTPSNFDISLFPLSKSFDEGSGRDVVYYSDFDFANFSTSSIGSGSWLSPGCSLGGGAEESCDFITASAALGGTSLGKTQHFSTGEEDLTIDVTKIVSATLADVLPDSGFRISLASSQENDQYSYFVKRFAARSAYNKAKHPRLIVRYDDTIQDDSQILRFGSNSSIFLRNYEFGDLANITSGSSLTQITGSNSLILRLTTVRSDGSGSYDLYFTGSQHSDGLNSIVGVYSASFTLSENDAVLKEELVKSGSVIFTPIWTSLDNSVAYFTGSFITAHPAERANKVIDFKNYVVTTSGLQALHRTNENVLVRVNVFDYTSPNIKLVKRPIELAGIVLRKAYYQIRDVETNEVVIPFDETYNSNKLSSDYDGMYFTLDTSSLTEDRSYVIDAMLNVGGTQKIFKSISNVFKVSDTQPV